MIRESENVFEKLQTSRLWMAAHNFSQRRDGAELSPVHRTIFEGI